ncbi:helix-turn-helix domain-containing protein [Desulfogranum japonicum]|uniref:helix-turn-helix domain-containing protein n=1 Tax=Desulfogranum japonicum TaxID=231447 RepID=UPI0004173F4C|nr:helix-turn-helix transcriptional regulator [Desulfogranum japonicum]
MNIFFKRLQYVAAVKKINQVDIVKGTGKASSTVSNWWNGNIVPGKRNTDAIAHFIGCDPNWLRTGVGEPFPGGHGNSIISGSKITGSQIVQSSTTGNLTFSDGNTEQLLVSTPFLVEIDEWLEEMEKDEPGFKTWFKIEFQNKFLKFAEWKKK